MAQDGDLNPAKGDENWPWIIGSFRLAVNAGTK